MRRVSARRSSNKAAPTVLGTTAEAFTTVRLITMASGRVSQGRRAPKTRAQPVSGDQAREGQQREVKYFTKFENGDDGVCRAEIFKRVRGKRVTVALLAYLPDHADALRDLHQATYALLKASLLAPSGGAS